MEALSDQRQPVSVSSQLPCEVCGAARAARPHPWPEMIGVAVGCGVVWFSRWAIPAVLFGCVIVAILGGR
jgi:hypothetical protein